MCIFVCLYIEPFSRSKDNNNNWLSYFCAHLCRRVCLKCGVYVPLGGSLFYPFSLGDVPLVECMYLVFTRMPGEGYHWRLRALLLFVWHLPSAN